MKFTEFIIVSLIICIIITFCNRLTSHDESTKEETAIINEYGGNEEYGDNEEYGGDVTITTSPEEEPEPEPAPVISKHLKGLKTVCTDRDLVKAMAYYNACAPDRDAKTSLLVECFSGAVSNYCK